MALVARQAPDQYWVIEHEQQLRNYIASNPWRSWLLGLGVYTLLSLIPGLGGKAIVFAWLFGFWKGVAMISVGLTTAAIIAFLMGRFVITDLVGERPRLWLSKVSAHFATDQATCLLILRLIHTPYTLLNYAAAVSDVRLRTFWWTTQVGTLPGIFLFSAVGARIPTLSGLYEQGMWAFIDPWLAVSFVALSLFPILVHYLIQLSRRNVRDSELPSHKSTSRSH